MEKSLNPEESFDRGIRRIYKESAEDTASVVSPPHEDIHESIHTARKNLKFMRALLRLARSPLGQETFDNENRALRDMGRVMSDLRDGHVLVLVLHYVAREAHTVKPPDIADGISVLEQRIRVALEEATGENRPLLTIPSELRKCSDRAGEWPEIPDSLDALLPGMGEVYRKGRERFQLAKDEPVEKHFHEWRKQVKYLLHQHEILVHYWPKALGINQKSLHQLSDYLGEEHDLAMLADQLDDEEFSPNIRKVDALASYIQQKRSFLQRNALNLGEFIYSKSEEEFLDCFRESADITK